MSDEAHARRRATAGSGRLVAEPAATRQVARAAGGLVASVAITLALGAGERPDRVPVPGGDVRVGPSKRQRAMALAHCAATAPAKGSCTPAILEGEERRARVRVEPFLVDRTEVTRAAYRSCVDEGACDAPDWDACRYGNGEAPTPRDVRILARETHPAVCLTFEQARRYCRWRGGDVPDEAQWERAAGGGLFPWGEGWDGTRCNWGDDGAIDGHTLTAPVGSFPDGASPYGVEDLVGNAWEWVVRLPELDGERDAGERQAIRGGGFAAAAHAQRVHKRASYDAVRGYPNVGFRCAYGQDPGGPVP
jgi:formylglycine-generating enzyme required for sulfatase activity